MAGIFGVRPTRRACTKIVAGTAALSLAFGATAANAEEPADEGTILEMVLSEIAPETLENVANAEESDSAVSYTEDGVTAELPLSADGEITLASAVGNISLGLPFADQAKPVETPSSGVVAFDNGNSSSSVAAVHDDGSVQVNTVIESKTAPTRYSYQLTLPAGATLTPLNSGQILMSDEDGGDLGVIDAPWAKDSAGSDVPTRYEIDNGAVTQVVDHSAAYQYPIVADPVVIVTKYEYKYVNTKRTYNWTNKKQQLGICKIEKGAANGNCKISNSYSSKTEVGASFGLAKWLISAGIGINYTQEASGSISWTSPKAPVGSQYKAWAVGTRTTYNIQQWKVTGPAGSKAGQRRTLHNTSGQLAAFSPVKGFAVGQ